MMTFVERYRALEARFRRLADAEGDVYLPNVEPVGPVDLILLAMEPSLGRWACTRQEADARITAGLRNFLWSLEDFLLHYAARTVLGRNGRTYHVTDLSKGAMLVAKAGVDRARRYDRWYGLFLEEMNLLAHRGTIVCALGRQVADYLGSHHFPRQVVGLLHYSAQAALGRKRTLAGREAEFQRFASTVTLSDILREAHAIMEAAGISDGLRAEIMMRLGRSRLSDSRKGLLFIYTTRLEALWGSRSRP